MRSLMICFLIAGLCQPAPAQPATQVLPSQDAKAAEVAAATDSAVAKLMDQIQSQQIAPNLSVKDFLDKTGGAEEFRAILARVDPVGGARWLDDQTCQVRLEVSGTEIVADLANIAVKHAAQSPIPAGALASQPRGLGSQWFAATGTSTAAGVAPPPPADSPWAPVPADQRRRAVAAADADAAHNVITSIEPVELVSDETVGKAMTVPAVHQSLGDWLTNRPVTAVDYRQNDRRELEVEVTLSASPADLFDILRAAVTARNDVPHPNDPAGWAGVRLQVILHMAPPVGRATITAVEAPLTLPNQPPDWAGTMADVTGTSSGANALMAARAAEADALARLRGQVLALRLSPDLTVGQAHDHDAQLARAIDRAINGAVLYNTQYNPDGSVVCRMSLDLRLVWTAIQNRR